MTDSERIDQLEAAVEKLTQLGAVQQNTIEKIAGWVEAIRRPVEALSRIFLSMKNSSDAARGRGPGVN